MYKRYSGAMSRGGEKHQTEIQLCEKADFVVAVGPKLADDFSAYLRSCKKEVFDLTPSIFNDFAYLEQAPQEGKTFRLLLFGRSDTEDFELKGYYIAAQAVAELKDPTYHLIFVGAPNGKEEEVKENLLRHGISRSQLTVRSFHESREKLANLFCEADLAIMPSRTEGFGLTALEALSAGLPILVSGNSGFGKALRKVPFGSRCILNSEDGKLWAKEIDHVRNKDREMRLQECQALRIGYAEQYNWQKQCKELVEKLLNITHDLSGKELDFKGKRWRLSSSTGMDQILKRPIFTTETEKVFHDLQKPRVDANQISNEVDLLNNLRQNARSYGFIISNNDGGGNCMFYALAEQLRLVKGIHILHGKLRRRLVTFLQSNPKLARGTDLYSFVAGYSSWSDYLKDMGKDGNWGDHVVLVAAANCFQVPIRIISSLPNHKNITVDPKPPVHNTNPLVLGHVHELHYVSLLPVQGHQSGDHLPSSAGTASHQLNGSIPLSIQARGEEGIAAYRRAVMSGSTLDKRVNEDEDEPSTDGVLMNKPLKNVVSIPLSILARGEKEQAAYRRAVKFGWTFDKRVKILLVGQDRVGKTSVGRTLKGEKFNKNEPSTEGVLMNKPLKNVGQQAWKNSELHKDTSVYDHKCAEYVSRDLTRSPDHSVEGPTEEYTTTQTEDATTEPTGKPNSEQNKQPTQELPNMPAEVRQNDRTVKEAPPMDKETGTAESTLNTPQHVPEQEEIVMPDQVARLVENNLQEGKTDSGDGIWPVIWDFAGQAVYRAIHPIFLSPETVYILVFDLRKKLSDKARCRVKRDGRDEKEIQTCDYNDTNLDHIMRWMNLVHSFKTVPKGLPHVALPPVIIVGTLADSKDVNHNEKMDILMEKFCNTEEFEKHIAGTFVVDNTRAGQPKDQEDPAAKDLRDLILREASKMPYTQNMVPLQWLAVENKISETASQGLKYITRKEFKEKITNGICRFEEEEKENDIEVLLHFLHDRGSILYHDRADSSDGLVVLDPQWLIKVLCLILKVEPEDGERRTIIRYRKNLETKGILAEELLDHVCTKLGLVGIKGYLLHLMEKYNLLCSFKSKDEKEAYLVPCMVTARPDEQTTRTTSAALPPLFLTFKTKYVPCGLFPRLVLLFAKWAKSKCRFQPQLFANEVIFRVGKAHCLGFSCYKSVIKFFVWTQDDRSDPLGKEPQCCLEVLRFLKKSLDKLCEECHWLHSCSWYMCIQCNLCRRIPDAKSGDCYWHDEKECFHDDCAHYVDIPLNSEPLCCYRLDNILGALLPDREKFDPWIKAFTKLRDPKHQEEPETCSGHEVQPNSVTESPKVKEGTPSNEELEDVAEDIGDAWKKLGRRLKFKEATLTGFHRQHEEYSEKAYRMLLAWKKKKGRGASYQVLYDALCHRLVSRADLATTFCCVER